MYIGRLILLGTTISLLAWRVALGVSPSPDRLGVVARTPASPVIDGQADAPWEAVEAWSLADLRGVPEPDFGAWQKLMWDDEGLYLFVYVVDDDSRSDGTDAVELFFDGDGNGGWSEAEYRTTVGAEPQPGWYDQYEGQQKSYDAINDVQLIVVPGSDRFVLGNTGPGVTMGRADREAYWDLSSARVASRRTHGEKGYTVEVFLPWGALHMDMPVESGRRFGYDILCRDSDGDSQTSVASCWTPSPVGAQRVDPSCFAELELASHEPLAGYSKTIYRVTRAPVIDGAIDAQWKTVRGDAVAMAETEGPQSFVSHPGDYLTAFRAMWDSQNLYILVTAVDDTLLLDDTYPDGVELFVDADNSDGVTADQCKALMGNAYQNWMLNAYPGQSRTYDAVSDVEIWNWLGSEQLLLGNVGPGYTPGQKPENAWRASYWSGLISNSRVAQSTSATDDGYIIEMAIPWSALHVESALLDEGYSIGINVMINDADIQGERGYFSWRVVHPNVSWIDPSTFGAWVLSGREVPLTAPVGIHVPLPSHPPEPPTQGQAIVPSRSSRLYDLRGRLMRPSPASVSSAHVAGNVRRLWSPMVPGRGGTATFAVLRP